MTYSKKALTLSLPFRFGLTMTNNGGDDEREGDLGELMVHGETREKRAQTDSNRSMLVQNDYRRKTVV